MARLTFKSIKGMMKGLERYADEKPLSFMHISKNSLESIYSLGVEHYEEGNHREASPYFKLLIKIDPFQKKFWVAAAANAKMLRKFDEALELLSMVSMIDGKDPSPHIHAAEIYFELGDQSQAECALKQAELLTKEEDIVTKQMIEHVQNKLKEMKSHG